MAAENGIRRARRLHGWQFVLAFALAGSLMIGTVQIAQAAVLIGSPGEDVIEGSDDDDLIVGLGGDDRLFGGGGNDIIIGGPGDDHLNGGPGIDFCVGGPGSDTFSNCP